MTSGRPWATASAPLRSCLLRSNSGFVGAHFLSDSHVCPIRHRKTMSLRCGNDVSLWAVRILGSRVRESIADLPEQIVRSKCHPAGTWQMSTGHLHFDWFDSRPSSRYKKSTPGGVLFLYGAGYGNRTRLCGLGSDRSTDELTLRCGVIITDPSQKINPFLSNRSRLTVPEWTWQT